MYISCLLLYLEQAEERRKEQNDVSGSKGEANFVWRCKSCKVCSRLEESCLPVVADGGIERVDGYD